MINFLRLTGGTVALAVVLLLTAALLPQVAQARKAVLLVFDEDNDLPGLAVINQSLREVFRTELKGDVEFYSESLNLSQFKGEDYDDVLHANFQRKYAGKRPDLIVAVMMPSLDFFLRHGEALFPGIPIVFCGADASDVAGKTLRANITGVSVKRMFAPTLDIALRIQPETRNVFVVGGTSGFDRRLQSIARRDFDAFASRVRITYLTDLGMGDLLKTVSALPQHSVVFYLTLFADGAGRSFVTHEALSRISTAANAPVYASVDQYVGFGTVGGHVYSVAAHGRRAAEVGVRILHGDAPSTIPIVELAAYTDTFDWRQLQRWKLDERRLPAGSVLNFRPPSIWDHYKWYIVAGAVVFLLQSALVVGLLVSRSQRRRAEMAARESDERRRQAEEETRKKRDELAHALRLTTLGELTASFAHELGQPLTAILANARAARELLVAEHGRPEDVEDALADIAAAATQAGDTIQGLRGLFRKKAAEHAPVDVNVLVEGVLRLLRTDIEGKHILVRFTRGEGLPSVLGDSVQLRQVVMNLLVNAEDAVAAADGPCEIYIRTERTEAGGVAIAVRDTGIGAKEADLERIFERFVSTKPQGLGMGLAICRSIVETHGGRIWATQIDDCGLTFHIELPGLPAAPLEPPTQAPENAGR